MMQATKMFRSVPLEDGQSPDWFVSIYKLL